MGLNFHYPHLPTRIPAAAAALGVGVVAGAGVGAAAAVVAAALVAAAEANRNRAWFENSQASFSSCNYTSYPTNSS